jgi:glycosyltransferase involved in cell wall biosynthesis
VELKKALITTYFKFNAKFLPAVIPDADKVLVVAEFAPSGGAREYFKQLVTFLRAAGKQVLVLVPDNQADADIQNFVREQKAELQLIPAFPENVRGSVAFARRLSRHARKFQPAAIWISAATPGKWLAAGLLNIPLIYTLHTAPESGLSVFQRILLQLINAKLCIVTVSAFARAAIISRWQVSSEKVTVVANTVSPEVENVKAEKLEMRVVTVGHLEKWKNPQFWVQVAEKVCDAIPEVEFQWIGEGSLALHSHKYSDRIQFVGPMSNVATLQQIAAAQVYFQPSKQESFGMAVLEAMALGKPTVVSKMGGLPDLVVNEQTGFIVPISKPETAAEKIIWLLQNPDQATEMGMRAREKYQREYSPETWRARMQEVLDQAVSTN